jgi:dTDP-4-dehydrorhamnose reductase
MPQRLMITGARGFVAGSVLCQCPPQWEVHAVSREAVESGPGVHWHQLPNPSREAVHALCAVVRPDVILHAAAISNIDVCEADHALAAFVNTAFPTALAEWAGENRARLIFLSTDNVFDGKRGGYSETDPPNPVNFYGRTKAAAEQEVLARCANSVVARVALVVGLPVLGRGNSFLARMLPTLRAGERLGVPADEIRTPIDVATLGAALVELAGHPFCGILHLAGNERLDRLAMVRRIAAHLGLDADLVVAQDPAGLPGRAERPRDASMLNLLAQKTLCTPFCSLEEGITRALSLAEKENAAP